MSTYETIEVERQGRVAIVWWNRPDRLNAFNRQMLDEWSRVLAELNADDSVGALVVTGRGRAYSAGSDISGGSREPRDPSAPPPFEAEALANSKPIIGAINGIALGMGLTTALLFDFNIASTEARFSMRFAALGLTPEFVSGWMLPKIVGLHRAKEMMLTGDIYSAEDALSFGLVRQVVEPDALVPTAVEVASRIAANPTSTLASIKRLAWEELWSTDYTGTKRRSDEFFAEAEASPAFKEAMQAFAERRPPRFHGEG